MLSDSTISDFCKYKAAWFDSPLSEEITETVDDNSSSSEEIWPKKQVDHIKWNRSLVHEIKYLIHFNNGHINTLIESKENDIEIDEKYIDGNVHHNCIRILNDLKLLLKGSEGEEKLKLIKTITALASIQVDSM